MTVKTGLAERQQFFVLDQQEQTYAEIAERYGVSPMCVRYWYRRQRDGHSCHSRHPRRKQGLLSRFDPRVRYVLLRLRLEHPHWGPNRLREKMKKRPSLLGRSLPSEAEIGRYLHQWRKFRRKPNRKPACLPADQPTRVFQRWQMDFKVQIRLKNRLSGTLFSVRDEVGEAIMGNVFLLSGRHSRVKMEQARAVLRRCFEDWGTLPEEVQTDGESTLVSSHKNAFPSRFTLWLTGLAIQHRVIKNVTSNAEVERCHRTLCDYAIVGNEDHLPQELQWILDQSAYELNNKLPSQAKCCQGEPPVSDAVWADIRAQSLTPALSQRERGQGERGIGWGLAEEVAATRCVLRRTLALAWEAEEKGEVQQYIRLADVYGMGCHRLTKLLRRGNAGRDPLVAYVQDSFQTTLQQVYEEWGL